MLGKDLAFRDSSMRQMQLTARTGCHEHTLNFEHEVCEARLFRMKYVLSIWHHFTFASMVTRPIYQPCLLDREHSVIDIEQERSVEP